MKNNVYVPHMNYIKIIYADTQDEKRKLGKVFFPNIIILQIIGRLAFPIFAFFIAEGFYYTKSRKKYLLKLFIFAIISQFPYFYFFKELNILFTFSLSVVLLLIWEKFTKTEDLSKLIFLIIFSLLIFIIWIFGILGISYRIYGVLVPVFFYIFRDKKLLQYSLFCVLTIVYQFENFLLYHSYTFFSFIQLFSLLSIILIELYNNSKDSNKKLKNLFYIAYPLHLIILIIISLLF